MYSKQEVLVLVKFFSNRYSILAYFSDKGASQIAKKQEPLRQADNQQIGQTMKKFHSSPY